MASFANVKVKAFASTVASVFMKNGACMLVCFVVLSNELYGILAFFYVCVVEFIRAVCSSHSNFEI